MSRSDFSNYNLDGQYIDLLLEFFPKGVVAFDLEMTGLSPLFDKIIEIAAVKVNSDRSIEYFHRLVNPQIDIPQKTIEYHGITNEDVKSSPGIKKPLKEFVNFYGDFPLIAHNAQFDIGYIVKANYENGNKFSLSSVFDSCKFSRALYKKEKENRPENFKLSSLATYFNIELNHHQALDDAYVCLEIFARCLKEYNKRKSSSNFDKHFKELAFLFKLNSFKKATDYILPKKLQSMKEVLKEQIECKIQYKGGTNGSEYRPIRPISILPMPQGLVLYAKCLISNYNKHFLVKKIKSIDVNTSTAS